MCRRDDLGDLADPVLVPQQVVDLLVEHLPGDLPGLGQDPRSVPGVGVVAEIGALVDEPLARRVDDDPERVAVLLETVTDREIAELGSVAIPCDRVAAGPVAGGRRSGLERHTDPVPGVVPGAAHLGQIPARAQVARPPLGVGLEATGREHDGVGLEVATMPLDGASHALHDTAIGRLTADELEPSRLVVHRDAQPLGLVEQVVHESGATADHLEDRAAPEREASLVAERLAAVAGREPHAMIPHPAQGRVAVRGEDVGQVGVAPVVGDPPEGRHEVLSRVRAEVRVGQLGFAQRADELEDVVGAVVGGTHQPRGERGVPSAPRLRRPLEQLDLRAGLAGGDGGAQSGVPGPDHQDACH